MVTSTTTTDVTPAASLGRLFKGPEAILGNSWIDYVPTGWTNASLHQLVVSSGTIHAAKSRDVYGHFRTATQMSKTEVASIIVKILLLL
jgi:hypothetical protein